MGGEAYKVDSTQKKLQKGENQKVEKIWIKEVETMKIQSRKICVCHVEENRTKF